MGKNNGKFCKMDCFLIKKAKLKEDLFSPNMSFRRIDIIRRKSSIKDLATRASLRIKQF